MLVRLTALQLQCALVEEALACLQVRKITVHHLKIGCIKSEVLFLVRHCTAAKELVMNVWDFQGLL
jgi:hypothetical protein